MKNFYIPKEKFREILDIGISNPDSPDDYYTEEESLVLDELRKSLTEMLIEDHLLPEKGDIICIDVNNKLYVCELTRDISVANANKTYSIFNIWFEIYLG